jgi:hypothetical protein
MTGNLRQLNRESAIFTTSRENVYANLAAFMPGQSYFEVFPGLPLPKK